MIDIVRIVHYTGAVGKEALDAEQPSEHLTRIGLNAIEHMLSYAGEASGGLVRADEEDVRTMLLDRDRYLLVVRDRSRLRRHGSGEIMACACISHLHSLQRNQRHSLHVTDFAVKNPEVNHTVMRDMLLDALMKLGSELEVDRICFEAKVSRLMAARLQERGFHAPHGIRWVCLRSKNHARARPLRSGSSLGDAEERLDSIID